LFAASIGVIVAQIGMVSVLQGIGIGGWGFVVALTIAFGIAVANAMAYAEMALMMPTAGSLSSYAEAAIGNFPAILLVFAGYITPAIFGLPAELILTNQILSEVLPFKLPPYTCSVLLVVILTVLNILGTDVFARLQTVLSFAVLVFLLTIALVALSGHAAAPEVHGGVTHALANLGTHTNTASVIALAFWVLMGSEFVTPMIPEARNPNRDLPRAMLGGLLTIFAAQLLFSIGAGVLVPREKLMSSGAPHLEYAVAAFGSGARVAFAALALVASASLVNTVIAAVPRMLAGMAENGQVFPVFKWTHPRFGTPVIATLFVAALPLLGLAWSHGDVDAILPLTVAASIAWLLAYMMAQVSLLVLRQRYPQAPRPFRVPGYPIVPALALIGMVYVVANASPEPALTARIAGYTGIVLGLFAVVGGAWVKLVMRKGLFEPVMPKLRDIT
jgi:amino acid transporter